MPSQHTILTHADLHSAIACDLFSYGKRRRGDRIGLELELFPLLRGASSGTYIPVPVAATGAVVDRSLVSWLTDIAERNGWDVYCDEFSALQLGLPNGGTVTLEPAGQIEYSSPPLTTPRTALHDIETFAQLLQHESASTGIELLATGYNHLCQEETIPLQITKPRYRAMDRHFNSIGEYGRKMMRATCALQINLDFGTAHQTPRRWRLANMIAPSLNAIFANSPYNYQGKQFRSFRYEIWRHADPTRTGRLFDQPDLDPVADYLRFALDATVMMIGDDGECFNTPNTSFTFRQWMEGKGEYGYPTQKDWNLHLTTLFPDVRPRGFMELRTVDCPPPQWRSVPVTMATTLLYNDTLCDTALDVLERRERIADPNEPDHGGYWHSDFETGRELLQLAIDGTSDTELRSLARSFFEQYTNKEKTPADDQR